MALKRLRRLPPVEKWPDWVFFLILFCYPLIIGLLVQFVLLPYVFPSWHGGDGLLVGLDSRGFHHEAVELAEKIEAEGWQAWKLTAQPVTGIAAIFYVLIAPHPWAVLPLNSLLHTLAAWALYKTFCFFLEKRTHALLAALPLFIFPSSLLWVIQMHNENYSVVGGVLLLYAWVCLTRKDSWENWRQIAGAMASLLLGVGLTWLVREYVVSLYTAVGGLLFLFILIVFVVRLLRSRWNWKKTLGAAAVLCLAFLLIASMQIFNLTRGRVDFEYNYMQEITGAAPIPEDEQGAVPPTEPQVVPPTEEIPRRQTWQKSSWLPDWVDYQMEQLSIKRAKAIRQIWTEDRGGSNIDTDIRFRSAWDIIRYLPRAAEIGFLSPFPEDWFGQGSEAPNTMMRRVSAVEMSLVYLAWPGLLIACWVWRKRPEFWVGLIFCTGILILFTLGVPNVGTLYRLRYPFFMPMVGMGIAGWIVTIRALSKRFKKA